MTATSCQVNKVYMKVQISLTLCFGLEEVVLDIIAPIALQ